MIKQTTFWDGDISPVPKRGAVKKYSPPAKTWEAHDYLPNLKEALATTYDVMDDADIIQASNNKEILVFDIESYPNYFLLAFKSISTGKMIFFELTDLNVLDVKRVAWIMANFTTVGFNSNSYDLPLVSIALTGATAASLFLATTSIISHGERPSDVLSAYSADSVQCDHIDLIEVAPLSASLKIYGGRLHALTMADLPFKIGSVLTANHMAIMKWYCVNDLTTTEILYLEVEGEIGLRKELGVKYGMDLRSKSDAQIAESVIGDSIRKLTGFKVSRPPSLEGQIFKYQIPEFVKFKTQPLREMLDHVASCGFKIKANGYIDTPQYLLDKVVVIGTTLYNLGMGGLHSMEKRRCSVKSNKHYVVDMDVASYYPAIILRCGLYPQQLGMEFLTVYKDIVDRRLAAKASGDKLTADTLKITINGSFGKLGSAYSILYSPHLLIQVTLTGQLCLLMLIEELESNGIKVVSANTDGIVCEVAYDQQDLVHRIRSEWESNTTFVMESTFYERLHSRDVNNYMALTTDGKIKAKGAYAKPNLRTNPSNEICVEAIEAMFKDGTPVDITIKACKDIRKFVTVRKVKGGGWKDGEFLGKAVRWYYSRLEEGVIIYADSGNKVPNSNGAKPLMVLPETLPTDIDYDWYVREANKMLDQMCYT